MAWREVAPAIADHCLSAETSHSSGMTSYLYFMAQRLIECQRVAKTDGQYLCPV